MPTVTLSPVDPDRDMPLLEEWARRAHVCRWWGSPESVVDFVRLHPPAMAALIRADDRAVGYLCWQRPSVQELAAAGLSDLPRDLVDLDIMIGEPDALGRGFGPAALSCLLSRLRAEGIAVVGLAGATSNPRAMKAYPKAGFQPFRDFHEEGEQFRYFVQRLC